MFGVPCFKQEGLNFHTEAHACALETRVNIPGIDFVLDFIFVNELQKEVVKKRNITLCQHDATCNNNKQEEARTQCRKTTVQTFGTVFTYSRLILERYICLLPFSACVSSGLGRLCLYRDHRLKENNNKKEYESV